MTKRDWLQKSMVAVLLGTSLLMFAEGGQAVTHAAETKATTQGAQVAAMAKSLLGKPYKNGAVGPQAFGSAGFATYIYKTIGINIDDTMSKLNNAGKKVSAQEVQAGDLLFFSSTGKGSPTFMGVYIGSGQYMYASQGEKKVVMKNMSDYSKKLLSVRRILPEGTDTVKPPSTTKPDQNQGIDYGDKVVAAGMKYLGTPYEYGSTRSNKKTMDCSEFTMWAYLEGAGIDMGRGGATSQSNYVKAHGKMTTDINKLKKGDLVFVMAYKGFKESDYKGIDVSKQSINHVAIYLGDNKLLHTYSKESGGVRITDFKGTHWEYRFISGGRPY